MSGWLDKVVCNNSSRLACLSYEGGTVCFDVNICNNEAPHRVSVSKAYLRNKVFYFILYNENQCISKLH